MKLVGHYKPKKVQLQLTSVDHLQESVLITSLNSVLNILDMNTQQITSLDFKKCQCDNYMLESEGRYGLFDAKWYHGHQHVIAASNIGVSIFDTQK